MQLAFALRYFIGCLADPCGIGGSIVAGALTVRAIIIDILVMIALTVFAL